jgi:hypothetical protein
MRHSYRPKTQLYINVVSPNHPTLSYATLLEDVKYSVLLFILQILEEHPEYLALPYPKISMSGRGEACEAEWDTVTESPGVIVNAKSDVGQLVTNQLARELSLKFREKIAGKFCIWQHQSLGGILARICGR